MKPIPFERGRVVLSKQGRDIGRYFLTMAVTEDGYAFIADGELRKVEKPKKKKQMHLAAKPLLNAEIAHRIEQGLPVTNSDVRKALEALELMKRPTPKKEDCVLVQE